MARRSLKLLPLLIVAIGLTCVVSARAQDCDGWVALGEPSPRLGHAMVYDSARNVVVLFGGRLDPQTTSGAISAETWEFDGTRWRFRTGDGPLGRFDHAMAYDSDRHVTVLFGGNNIAVPGAFLGDTWEWDGNTWTQRAAPGTGMPAPRDRPMMAYDQSRHLTFMGGGASRVDTWTWDGAAWTQVATTGAAQSYYAMVYDPIGARLLMLYGGTLYTWSGTAWTSIGSAPRSNPVSMAYSAARGQVLALWRQSGSDLGLNAFSLQGSTWTQLPNPPAAAGLIIGSHDASNSIIALGLSATHPTPGPNHWTLGESSWVARPMTGGPSAAYGPSMAFDSQRGVSVLFGGSPNPSGSAPILRDTWELRGETWALRASAGPSARYDAGMAYDPVRHVTVLRSGYNSISGADGYTWEWDGHSWTSSGAANEVFNSDEAVMSYDQVGGRMVLLALNSGPYARVNAGAWTSLGNIVNNASHLAMAYDPVRGATILAGGAGVATYRLDGSTVTQVTPLNQTNYWMPRMAYDPGRAGIVLFGGFESPLGNPFFPGTGYFLGSTATAWTLMPQRGPAGRKYHTMAYDSLARRVVMYGGSDHTAVFRETWKLARGPAAIALPPANTTVAPGSSATLFAVARGGGVIDYQWKKDGVALADSARITGSRADTLVISNTAATDAGLYTLSVSNPCGQETSTAATLTLHCPADFDDGTGTGTPDGGITVDDLLYFLGLFAAGDVHADLDDGSNSGTPDGGVTIEDLLYFLARYDGGC